MNMSQVELVIMAGVWTNVLIQGYWFYLDRGDKK